MRDAAAFRQLFPALEEWAWLDTPGSPPVSQPVADVLQQSIADWLKGDIDWLAWDRASAATVTPFAALIASDPAGVVTVNSAADAMALVAANAPHGDLVVSDAEYQSVLFPLAAVSGKQRDLVRVKPAGAIVTTDDFIARIGENTALVAVSDTLSSTGSRMDLVRLGEHCRRMGARLVLDLTQSLGILDYDFAAIGADAVIAHGYKWLGAPRGAAWLWVDPAWKADLHPVAPTWRGRPAPFDYFGGDLADQDRQRGLDGSHAWLSWIGAAPALEAINSVSRADVEEHCLGLARLWEESIRELGYRVGDRESPSHISVAYGPVVEATHLAGDRVKLLTNAGRVRVGFHFFNNEDDVHRAVASLRAAQR